MNEIQDLTTDELQERYAEEDLRWDEHSRFSRHDWMQEVMSSATQRGYWDWVVSKIKQEAND